MILGCKRGRLKGKLGKIFQIYQFDNLTYIKSYFSDKSLIHSLNSGQRTGQSDKDNVWSLTNRIKGSGATGPDPEYTVSFVSCFNNLLHCVLLAKETIVGIAAPDTAQFHCCQAQPKPQLKPTLG